MFMWCLCEEFNLQGLLSGQSVEQDRVQPAASGIAQKKAKSQPKPEPGKSKPSGVSSRALASSHEGRVHQLSLSCQMC